MKKRIPAAFVLALGAAFVAAPAFAPPHVGAEVPAEVRAKAAGLLEALKMIEAERDRPAAASRSLTFSEAEFNAYVACRLDAETGSTVKSAEFRLLAGDRIEGRIAIDLGKPQASGLLPQKQDLLFSAGIETRDGRIKINMDKLFLGSQPIAPAVVDLLIAVASRLQGVEATSLEDWYDLPPGVLRLATGPGRIAVFY